MRFEAAALSIGGIFGVLFFASSAFSIVAPDVTHPGPFAISSGEYKFPASLDADVLSSQPTEIWAQVTWPKDLSTKHPIVFFLHGNHQTCGDGESPVHHDSDCTYTTDGTCPTGMIVVQNHLGYNYLATHLASYGFIVVSINANRGITCGDGDSDDSGLILARGRLILRHIQRWAQWSSTGGIPASLKVPQNAFVGAVDLHNIGLFGHSRGGEGVRAAYNLYRDGTTPWAKRIPGLEFRGIFEIGAVDGQSSRVLDADDVAWNQLLPMCDGDVSDLEGRLPFERMEKKPTEIRKTQKTVLMAWGTNHNFYNSEWQESDSNGCTGHDSIFGKGPTSIAQQTIAKIAATSFFLAHVGENRQKIYQGELDPLVSQSNSLTSITRVDRDFSRTNDRAFSFHVDDFDQSTGTSTHLVPNSASGIDVDNDSSDIPKRADISWRDSGPTHFLQTNWTVGGQGADVHGLATLDFRVSRQSSGVGVTIPTDFSIALALADGTLTPSVPLSRYISLLGPANSTTIYQTVRIPLNDFALGSSTKVQGVRFIFDRSHQGDIYLADVLFTSNNETAMEASLNAVLPPRTPMTEMKAEERSVPNIAENENILGLDIGELQMPSHLNLKPANLVSIEEKITSPFMRDRSVVEIAVHADKGFPVGGELPVLVLSHRAFRVSRYKNPSHLDTLIFTVSADAFKALPDRGPMLVQYGLRSPKHAWTLPDYDKAHLDQGM